MSNAIFDDHGVRFDYPADWEIDVGVDGPRTSVTIQSPNGPAFAIVIADEARPEPREMADEAVEALRGDYPELDATPASEIIDGHAAVGHDAGFFSLDVTNSCVIRCFRTPRRTIFFLAQWSDLEDDDLEATFAAVRGSIEETDA